MQNAAPKATRTAARAQAWPWAGARAWALQLQLLTRRNEAGPRETWGRDVASVLASAHSEGQARRLQNVLRVLLRG